MKFFFAILTIMLSIVFFELFLEYTPFRKGVSPVEYHKDIGMWHKKNFSSYLVKECYQTQYFFDKKGRVKNNYVYDRDKEDVVILGDSYIEALMVENDKIIHNSLFSELDGRMNVLNYGLTGSGPMQHFSILKHEVNVNNIKKVIHFIYLEDDLGDGDPQKFNGSNRPKVFMEFSDLTHYRLIPPAPYSFKEQVRDFVGKFELYSYFNQTRSYYKEIWNKSDEKIVSKKVDIINNERYRWKQLKGTIYQIHKLALDYKFEYIIIINSANELNFNKIKQSREFETFLRKEKIDYLNIASFLKKLKKIQPLSFECDGHWNGETHKALAKHIHEKLF